MLVRQGRFVPSYVLLAPDTINQKSNKSLNNTSSKITINRWMMIDDGALKRDNKIENPSD
jgi:hypothetical protein